MRQLLLILPVLVLSTSCSAGPGAGGGAPQPQPPPGAVPGPLKATGPACGDVAREGQPVGQALIVGGCMVAGKSVVITTRRCKDGRTVAIYRDVRGFVGARWESVGPGKEARARAFATC